MRLRYYKENMEKRFAWIRHYKHETFSHQFYNFNCFFMFKYLYFNFEEDCNNFFYFFSLYDDIEI